MYVEQTPLPGIGVRHVFTTVQNQYVGTVWHRTGGTDLVVYDVDDPDAALTIPLTRPEAVTLARLLGMVGLTSEVQNPSGACGT